MLSSFEKVVAWKRTGCDSIGYCYFLVSHDVGCGCHRQTFCQPRQMSITDCTLPSILDWSSGTICDWCHRHRWHHPDMTLTLCWFLVLRYWHINSGLPLPSATQRLHCLQWQVDVLRYNSACQSLVQYVPILPYDADRDMQLPSPATSMGVE